MQTSTELCQQNGLMSEPNKTKNSESRAIMEDRTRPHKDPSERATQNKETRPPTECQQTGAKKKSDGGPTIDPFPDPPCGSAGFTQFLWRFQMEATHRDPQNHSISYNLPALPLTRDRNGHAYIADLVFQIAPGIFFHMYRDKSRQGQDKLNDFWSLDVHKMAAGRACSITALKTVLAIDPAMYRSSFRLTSLPVDARIMQGGKKHFFMAQDFWAADRSQRIMRALSTCMFFDTISRSAIELPRDLVSCLPGLESELIPSMWHQSRPAPPPQAFRYTVRVVWGHVDFNGQAVITAGVVLLMRPLLFEDQHSYIITIAVLEKQQR
ncbi:hypothetical protein EGW08_018314 [Elysia chlorotica]|uniref:Uncharacterized protein n=1 Tax=Elysia chlorotica TaxID=188477 RepID=A0A3S1H7V5_ELYCH|nr:hypothetical protein EGW08_018314 [Elysia chlorotica]